MPQSFFAQIENVVIPSGESASRTIFSQQESSDAVAISIQAPAALDAIVFSIEASNNGTVWATLSDGTADLPAPAAGKVVQYVEMLSVRFWRIRSASNVAADRTFIVTKQWTT